MVKKLLMNIKILNSFSKIYLYTVKNGFKDLFTLSHSTTWLHNIVACFRHVGRDYDTEIKDDSVAPRFLLPLVDQSRKIGESVEFSVTGQTGL